MERNPREVYLERLKKSSKELVISNARLALEDNTFFEFLLELAFKNGVEEAWRAAWALDTIANFQPDVLRSKVPYIARVLPSIEHKGQRQCLLRLISRYPTLDDETEGYIVEHCFNQLILMESVGYNKALSIKILDRLMSKYTELQREFVLVLEDMMSRERIKSVDRLAKEMLKKYK